MNALQVRLGSGPKNPKRPRRRLNVESLERRELLANVTGIVTEDFTADGITSDDLPLAAERLALKGPVNSLLDAHFGDMFSGPSLDGFAVSGAWHLSTECAEQPGQVGPWIVYFGVEPGCTLEGATDGALTSPPVAIPPGVNASLKFNYRLEGKPSPQRSTASVLLAVDGGEFVSLASNVSGGIHESTIWSSLELGLSAYAGNTVSVRFEFATVDCADNLFLGWQLDDIQIVNQFVRETTTDGAGQFVLTDIPAGTYTVDLNQPASWVRTVLPQSVDVNNEYDDVGGVNIATFELGQVRGQLILDANADGTKSAGEGGLNDLLVDLLDSAGQVVATTSAMELDVNGDGAFDAAAEYGLFSFSGLAPGAYAIRPRLPAGWDASWARTTPLTIQGNRSGDVVTPLYGLISPYSYSHNVPSPIPANQTVHIVRTPIHIEPNGFFYQYSSRIWNGTGYEDANTVPIYQAVAGSGNFLSNCGKYSGILSIDYGEVFTNDAMDNQGLSFGVPGGCPGDGSQIRQGGIVSWNPTLPPGVLTKLQGDDTKTLYAGGRRDIVESRWVDLSFGWTQWFGYWETAREEHSKYADHVGMTARPSGQLFSFNMELHTRYKNDSTGALVATCAGHWRLDIYAPRVEIISPTPPAPWFQNAIGFPKSYAQSFSFDPCTSHEVS